MIKKNDVVQFTENHKWVGCFGYVKEVEMYGGGFVRYTIGVPMPINEPMKGAAYIFDDGSGIEKVGTAVLVPAESEKERVADAFMDALSRICDAVARPATEAEEDSMTEEQMDGGEHEF